MDLKFKGERTYLRGTDMIDAVLTFFPGLKDISVRFQKIPTRQLVAVVLNEPVSRSDEMTALLRGRLNEYKVSFGMLEMSDGEPPGRYAYDDSEVIANAEVDPGSRFAEMRRNRDFSTIEQCVDLHKALLVRCFAHADIHWIFSRLEVSGLPAEFDVLSLRVTQALGRKLVRSAIALDGTKLGDIYFSGVLE
ncbi:MAG: hypothetical protein OXC93_12360 [Rhodospirillaceae bacterium]|nr:hypothetical protein [Rhodospirillaceae bacterium]